jgi:hypothetical protein
LELYERIELSGVPKTDVAGRVVNDLVHLLAELLENATAFSSPHTKVRVTATRLPDGRVMVEIHDKGIGLTAEDFAEINQRLADPPAVDVEVSRRMGLFVVGRLSLRHGIRVQLRPSGEQSGTTSLVMLPEAITHGGGGEPMPQEEFTVSRIVPESPFAAEPAPAARTAAELGFDDTRYSAVEAAELDPVSRSLRRGERHVPVADTYAEDTSYSEGGYQDTSYQDTSYQGTSYQDGYPGGGYQDGYPEEAGYQAPAGGSPGPAYGEGAYPAAPYAAEPFQGGAFRPSDGYAAEAPGSSLFEGGTGRTGTPPMTPPGGAQRVGFDGAGPPPDSPVSSTTHAGLPRREPQRRTEEATGEQRPREEPLEQAPHESQWDRGPRREAAQPGGTTSSGQPKRVPKANLTEHTAAEPAAGGPQVSRSPEDVRGRLSNLHRGVRQGRGASKGRAQNDHEGFGPGNDQER